MLLVVALRPDVVIVPTRPPWGPLDTLILILMLLPSRCPLGGLPWGHRGVVWW